MGMKAKKISYTNFVGWGSLNFHWHTSSLNPCATIAFNNDAVANFSLVALCSRRFNICGFYAFQGLLTAHALNAWPNVLGKFGDVAPFLLTPSVPSAIFFPWRIAVPTGWYSWKLSACTFGLIGIGKDGKDDVTPGAPKLLICFSWPTQAFLTRCHYGGLHSQSQGASSQEGWAPWKGCYSVAWKTMQYIL